MMLRKIEGLESIQGYRIMKLAIKKLEAVFWKTDLSVEDIQKMLQAGKITEEWLVCPQGEVGDAVLISEFLANPSIFESISKSNAREKEDECETKPKKNDLKKRIIIAVLKGYAIGAVTGAIFVSVVSGVIGIRAFFAALLMAPLTLFYCGDVLETPGLLLLLGVAITQFVALFVNGRRTGRPRLIVIGSFVLAALLAFLGGSAASYLVYAY